MQIVFYILLYIGSVCPSLVSYSNGFYNSSCSQSGVEMKIADSLDSLLAYKNARGQDVWRLTQKEPDKIYRITMQDGKVVSEKEVKIVPVIKKIKTMIEQEKEVIEGYRIE